MTKIITQCLNIIDGEFILIDKDGIMCWTRSPLQTRMRKQEEIIELRMCDVGIDDGASGTVTGAICIATVGWEEACVMTFCDDDEGDVGTVTFFKSFAGRANCFDLSFDDVCELALGDTITEEQDTFRLRFGLLIKCLLSDGI